MKLITYLDGGDLVPGIVIDDKVVPVESLADRVSGAGDLDSVVRILEAGAEVWPALAGAAAEVLDSAVPLVDVELSVPVPHPKKIICIGLNYQAHVDEASEIPGAPDAAASSPVLFAKWENSLLPHEGTVLIPGSTEQMDWEAELAAVIGRRATRVSRSDALSYVGGYTAFNDISARDLQLETPQWTAGKACDTFGPCGPWLVTADEIPDPQTLRVQARVNGETMQDANTETMLFPVDHLISFISSVITLEPGDIIATGTPSGMGHASRPSTSSPETTLRSRSRRSGYCVTRSLLSRRLHNPGGLRFRDPAPSCSGAGSAA